MLRDGVALVEPRPRIPEAGGALLAPSIGPASRRFWAAALASLCLLTLALCVWEAAGDAPTIDEPVYVSAGTTALVRRDLRLNPQHPPLSKVLAALAVLPAEPYVPAGAVWRHHNHRAYAAAFLQGLRRHGQLREVTFLSRMVPILELVLTGLLVYALARRIAGPPGGLFAAAMWLLNPFVIGIGHLDGIDVPFTLMTLFAALSLVRWLEQRTPARLLPLGIACGAALVTRDTGPLVLLAALATVSIVARDVRPALIVGAVTAAFVWLLYLVLDPVFTLHHPDLLPSRYISGFAALARAHGGATGVFMFGRHWHSAHWYFWPLSALYKMPITLLAAFALLPLFVRRVPPEAKRVYLAVVPAAVLLALFTIAAPVYLGLRYMIPVIALMVVAAAPVVRAPRIVPVLLVAGSAFFTVTSAPHSIAWVAPPFHPGYRVTTDSNLDWGQDVYALQRWARGKHPWLACYAPRGSGCITGVPGARELGKYPPRGIHGWVAISSTLMNLDDWDTWLHRHKPAGTINGTILLYRL